MNTATRSLAMALAISVSLPALAHAQTANEANAPEAAATDDQGLADIIVTAQRREENLQRVPVSVTALNSAKLEQLQVTDVISLNRVVPGLQAKPTLTPLEISIAIRGVTQLIPSINADPAIGSYVDGVYNVVNAGSNNAIIDMERVEVLKGPQGTLFGRNTIGGAISITTTKPTDEMGGSAELSYGNYNAFTGTGVLNLPVVSGTVDTRFVYQHTQHDGYGDNFTTGNPASTFKQDYMRGAVKFTLSPAWDAIVTGFYAKAHGFGFPTNLASYDKTNFFDGLVPALSGNPGDLLSNYVNKAGRGSHDSYSNRDSRFRLKQYGVTGTINGQLGDAVNVRSITGYSNTDYNTVQDLDGTPYVVLELVNYPIKAKQFSEELQVFGDAMDGRLKWIAGGYYFRVQGSQFSNAAVLSVLAGPNINVGGPIVDSKSYSAFAQVTYEIADNLRLTGGVRYVVDKRHVEYRDHIATPSGGYAVCNMANAPGDPNPANCVYNSGVKYDYVPFTIGLDYQVNSDTLVYAKFSRGFRSGAYGLTGPAATFPVNGVTVPQAIAANALALDQFAPVAPEKLSSPEIGVKLDLYNHRLRINAAAYYSNYRNIQLTVNGNVPAGCTSCTPPGILTNSGTAHIYGGELEVSALLGDLRIDANLGYARPKYVGGPQVGTPIVNVSKLNSSLNLTYPVETRIGVFTVGGTWSYRSKMVQYSLSPGLSPSLYPTFSQNGFSLFDARASLDMKTLPITFSVFGLNLANKKYIAAGTSFAPPLAYTSNSPGSPRTFGVSAKVTF